MKQIDESALQVIAEVICGPSNSGGPTYAQPGPYRTMVGIREFFNRAGVRPASRSESRGQFALDSVRSVNGERDLEKVILRLASPKEYRGDPTVTHGVINYLNQSLRLEGLEIELRSGVEPQIRERAPDMASPPPTFVRTTPQPTRQTGARAAESPTGKSAPDQGQGNRDTKSSPSTVFIGHGHSPLWLELKNFLEERLELSVDEFSSISNAGRPTTDRLSEMMVTATAALLLMTGEDETADGKLRARENVVHEAGLFQGRLGFGRAIVLLEHGCEEFSNIIGLGEIRFQKGDIKSAFEEIRMFLERESIISKK